MPRTQVNGPSVCLENLSALVEHPLRILAWCISCVSCLQVARIYSSGLLGRGAKNILRHIVFA